MKTIYILLTRSGTLISRMVHLVTSDAYTHVSISFNENLQPLYSSARKNGRTIVPAGPCTEMFNRGYYNRHPYIPYALYELKVSDEVYERAMQETDEIFRNAEKYHFNFIGLFLCRLNIPFHRKSHFFCSQLVSEILSRSNALTLPKDTSLMRPMDYTKMQELTCVSHGVICTLAKRQTAQ